MSKNIGKDILFYSNYCDFSKEIVNNISNNNLSDNFVFICVDDKNIELPTFLKVVPTIFNIHQKEVLIEEDLDNYLNNKLNKINEKVDTNDLDTYFNSNNNFSSYYSTIDSTEDRPTISDYCYIDQFDSSIDNNQNKNNIPANNSKTQSAYEQMQRERENDFAGIKRI